jgi:CheY-like chemotaxis protein
VADCYLTGEPLEQVRLLVREVATSETVKTRVLLTAYMNEELIELASEHGIEHVWSKPLPIQQLSSKIYQLLELTPDRQSVRLPIAREEPPDQTGRG